MANAKSKDFDIRAAVVRNLLASGYGRQDIRHEIPLNTASSGGRLDLLIFDKRNDLTAIELKSGTDTLTRLEDQRAAALKACAAFVPVVDNRHFKKLMKDGKRHRIDVFWDFETGEFGEFFGGYVDDDPKWKTAENLLSTQITRGREWGGRNLDQSVVGMFHLLWADQARWVSERLQLHRKTRCDCVKAAHEEATLKDVKPLVIESMRTRPLNRWEEAFWAEFDTSQSEGKE